MKTASMSIAILVLVSISTAAAQSAADRALKVHRQKHAKLQAEFERRVEEVAKWCEENELVDLATKTREMSASPDPRTLGEARLPQKVQRVIPAGAVGKQRTWYGKTSRIRTDYARELYRLSRTVLDRYPSYAMDLVREVAFHDPDNRNARKILGYVQFKDKKRADESDYLGEWVTPFEARMRGGLKRMVWSDKYGWVQESKLAKYEQGLRPSDPGSRRTSWISAEKDAQIHRDLRNPWKIETEHFIVKTNHSLKRGVEIAKQLEEYYTFFRRTFASFFETPEQLRDRFIGAAGARRPKPPKQMLVQYYRTKEEYVSQLIKKIPQIADTEGLYYEPDRTAYFFDNPDRQNDGTLFHEATHLFFDIPTVQNRRNAAQARRRALQQRVVNPWILGENENFWIIEAIACYMESFERTKDGYRLGNPNYIRFRGAHHRLMKDEFFVPLKKYSAMGIREFQSSTEIAKLYTQGSGLAHFLMHYENGKYRDALVRFIGELYRPNLQTPLKQPSLESATGVSFAELGKQYKEYMQQLYEPKQAKAADSGSIE